MKPFLINLYQTRAVAYRDAVQQFIVGYKEGFQQANKPEIPPEVAQEMEAARGEEGRAEGGEGQHPQQAQAGAEQQEQAGAEQQQQQEQHSAEQWPAAASRGVAAVQPADAASGQQASGAAPGAPQEQWQPDGKGSKQG